MAIPEAAELQPVLVLHDVPPVALYKSLNAEHITGLLELEQLNVVAAHDGGWVDSAHFPLFRSTLGRHWNEIP